MCIPFWRPFYRSAGSSTVGYARRLVVDGRYAGGPYCSISQPSQSTHAASVPRGSGHNTIRPQSALSKGVGKPETQAYLVDVARDDEALVTIATFSSTFEASLARGALERIGIAAFVPDETSGTFSSYSRQPGGSALKVFESDRDSAIAELRRSQMDLARPPSEAV
jgi:hypothetical protein